MTSEVSSGTLPFQLGKDKGQARRSVLGAEFRHLLPRTADRQAWEREHLIDQSKGEGLRLEMKQLRLTGCRAAAGSLASTSAAVHHVACIPSHVLKVQ